MHPIPEESEGMSARALRGESTRLLRGPKEGENQAKMVSSELC